MSIFTTNDGPSAHVDLEDQMRVKNFLLAAISDEELVLMHDLDMIKDALRARLIVKRYKAKVASHTIAMVASQVGMANHWKLHTQGTK